MRACAPGTHGAAKWAPKARHLDFRAQRMSTDTPLLWPASEQHRDIYVLYYYTRCEDPFCCLQCMLPGRCAGSLSINIWSLILFSSFWPGTALWSPDIVTIMIWAVLAEAYRSLRNGVVWHIPHSFYTFGHYYEQTWVWTAPICTIHHMASTER